MGSRTNNNLASVFSYLKLDTTQNVIEDYFDIQNQPKNISLVNAIQKKINVKILLITINQITMKKTSLIIGLFFGLMACNQPQGNHPDFEANVAIAKKFIQLHQVEDYKAQESLLHDDLILATPCLWGS